jgi:hypothetical protein
MTGKIFILYAFSIKTKHLSCKRSLALENMCTKPMTSCRMPQQEHGIYLSPMKGNQIFREKRRRTLQMQETQGI